MTNNKSNKKFHFNTLSIELHPEVYNPAEDTFLLLEAIEVDPGELVFEIGTGCGIIALDCARIGANVLCSDINPLSIQLVEKNYKNNIKLIKGRIEIRCGYLFDVVSKDDKFDVIIFNPPYLPVKDNEKFKDLDWIDIATNGGIDGLELISKFIEGSIKHLKPHGEVYFVFSSLADRVSLNKKIKDLKLKSKIVKSQKFLEEKIDIYKIKF